MGKKDLVIIGKKFNFLTCIELPVSHKSGRYTIWTAKFKCDCGIIKDIQCVNVVDEKIKSCGCLNRKLASERTIGRNTKYDKEIAKSPLYNSWKSMVNRHKDKVCEDWLNDYLSFYKWATENGYSKGLVLTRKNKEIPYGPDNCIFVTKSLVSKNNLNIEKQRQTCLKKYGKESFSQTDEYLNRVISTNNKRYGCNFVTQNKEVIDKAKATNLIKYGYERASKSPEVIEKTRLTCLEKYGVNSPSQNSEIRDKQIATCIDRYGKPFVTGTKLVEQNSIKEYLENITKKPFESNYTILNGKEIDIYNEDLKIGIEYCGLRWHTYDRVNNSHFDKFKNCENKNVRLITIFSDEWIYRKAQVKSYLRSVFNCNTNKIYARKCSIDVLSKDIGMQFIDNYHIQGSKKKSLIYFGLIHNGELLGVMSFGRHHRGLESLVLDRMCFLPDTTVVGGASKLFKNGIKYANDNGYKSIVSWSDNRWSSGNVYKKLGFTMDGELRPDYSYINYNNPKKRIAKQQCKKKNIKCPENMTEKAFMLSLGFKQILDCGKKRWKFLIQ